MRGAMMIQERAAMSMACRVLGRVSSRGVSMFAVLSMST